jgi:hypothetical protein
MKYQNTIKGVIKALSDLDRTCHHYCEFTTFLSDLENAMRVGSGKVNAARCYVEISKRKKTGLTSLNKGKRGEREVIDWLQPFVDAVFGGKVLLQRNTVQSDVGGSDIIGLDELAFEVKNHRKATPAMLDEWWHQACEEARGFKNSRGEDKVPILVYKITGRGFRVRMRGCLGHGEAWEQVLVDVSAPDFAEWFQLYLRDLASRLQT